MKAAYLQNHRIHVGEVPDPVPAKGQALVRTHSCGLCASDAHFLHLGEKVVEMSKKFGGPYSKLDLSRVIVPGHEYVGEIIDYGPGSRRPLKPGTRVTSQPVLARRAHRPDRRRRGAACDGERLGAGADGRRSSADVIAAPAARLVAIDAPNQRDER
jgi:threonine dehydrogenase-like Zn-dependent dehydrogenase